MPLVKSDVEPPNGDSKKLIAPLYDTEPTDREREYIAGRIRNGKKLLSGAAIAWWLGRGERR